MRTTRIVAQALPIILVSLLGEMLAGSIFGTMSGLLAAVPGLIIMVPALLLLRGNINASLGSRLTSAVHLGLVPSDVPHDHPEVQVNVRATLVLGVLLGALSGLLAHGFALQLGGRSAGWLPLTAIGTSVGLLSGLPMLPITTRTVRAAFRRGVDPDNVIGPALLTLGDVLTIIMLLATAAFYVEVLQ